MLDAAIEFLKAWSLTRGLKFEVRTDDTIYFSRFHFKQHFSMKLFQIVIVDDGSKDSTCTVVHKYMQSSNFIRLVKLGKNRGKGGAVKQGVKEARGRYILMVSEAVDGYGSLSLQQTNPSLFDILIG